MCSYSLEESVGANTKELPNSIIDTKSGIENECANAGQGGIYTTGMLLN